MGWEARYIGAPYNETGGPPGYHCWSLVRAVLANEAGILFPTYGEISARDVMAIAREMGTIPTFVSRVLPEQAQPFDIVLMSGRARLTDGSKPRRANVHCGVMMNRNCLLHTEEGVDVHFLPLTHPAIRFRLVALYRHEMLTCSR